MKSVHVTEEGSMSHIIRASAGLEESNKALNLVFLTKKDLEDIKMS